MFRERLAEQFPALTGQQLTQLENHFETLTAWNQKMNLTRIEGVEEALQYHYFESLLLAYALPEGPLRIADVGSGGGFPGIPIGIARPESSVVLIESHGRKAVFLSEASRQLQNVSVFSGRAESCPWRGDWIVSRAVKPSEVLKLGLAPRAALLMGADDLPGLPPAMQTQSITGSINRVIAMFHVEQS